MHGQGEAWSLVCGLWAPGDTQFQISLPVACGALPRVTVEFPSCSWERNMESKSKNEGEGPKNPEVDQDLKAMDTNDQSINVNKPELFNDSSTDLSVNHSNAPLKPAMCAQNVKTISINEFEMLLVNTKDNQDPTEINAELTIDVSNAIKVTNKSDDDESVPLLTNGEREICEESFIYSSKPNPTEDEQAIAKLSIDEEGVTVDHHHDCKQTEDELTSVTSVISDDTSKSADASIHPPPDKEKAGSPESKSKSLGSNLTNDKPQPETAKAGKKVAANLVLKESISRFLEEGMSIHEAVGKFKELLLQEGGLPEGNTTLDGLNPSVAKSANLSANKDLDVVEAAPASSSAKALQKQPGAEGTLSSREEKFCFNHDQLIVYNCWRERGLDHEDAWAKVQQIKHLTEESRVHAPSGMECVNQTNDTWSIAPGFTSHVGISSSDLEFVNQTRKTWSDVKGFVLADFSSKGIQNERPVLTKVGKKQWDKSAKKADRSSLSPNVASACSRRHVVSSSGDISGRRENLENRFSHLPTTNLVAGLQGSGPLLPLISQGTSSIPLGSQANPFGGSSSAVQAGILINGFNSGGIVESLITSYLTGSQHLLAIPPVPCPVPGPSSLKRSHVSEEHGVFKVRRFDEPSTNLLQTTIEQPNPKEDLVSRRDPLHVCIVPSGYPKERLTEKQMDAIENSILDAILEIDDESMKPIFKGSFRKKGRYEILCQNILAKHWLDKYSSCMYEPWPKASLKIIPSEPESEIAANALLPLCKNDDSDRILGFIAKQNIGLNTGQWEVVLRSDGAASTSLSLLIDEESAKILKSKPKINFKMGTADIELIKDPNAEHLENSKFSSGTMGTTWAKADRSREERALDASCIRRDADKFASSWISSAGSLHLKHPQDVQHLRYEKSTEIVKNEGNINYKRKVTADMEKNEVLETKHRGSSVLSADRSGAAWGFGASMSASHEGGRAGEHHSSRSSSTESLHTDRSKTPQGKRHHGFYKSSRISSSELSRYKQPSRHDRPRRSGYYPSGSYDRLEGQSSGKQSAYADPSWSGPSSSMQFLQQTKKPNAWVSKSPSPEHSRYIEPHGVSQQHMDKPTIGRSYIPGESSMYNEPFQCYQSLSNDDFPERRTLEQSTGLHLPRRIPSSEYRRSSNRLAYTEPFGSTQFNRSPSGGRFPSNDYFQERRVLEENTGRPLDSKRRPSPECRRYNVRSAHDEIFGSTGSYQNTSSESTVPARFATIENSYQVRTQRVVRVWSPSEEPTRDRSSIWSQPRRQMALSGYDEYTERDRSDSSRPEHQRHSLRSPPPPPRLSKYSSWE